VNKSAKETEKACRLLEMYQVATCVNEGEIKELKTHNSKQYGMQHIYSFSYKDKRYYATDDYSLMDNPKFVKDVLLEVVPKLNGRLLKYPIPQSDGAIFASGIDGKEYYLWED
jgi:hypothetical protein